ncbi:hypothetical protein BH20ACI2_BH20ACI2_27280 [soil metagenome]
MKNTRRKCVEWMQNAITGLARCCLAVALSGSLSFFGQEVVRTVKGGPSSLVVSNYTEIAKATEACTPEECEWWKQLRESGNNLLRKADDKWKKRYISFFIEGIENSYRVPLGDRSSQLLVSSRPAPPAPGVRPRNGKVELSVEVRADGSVGVVKVMKSLRNDMDQLCVQSQRESIYLPAIKDWAFVTEWRPASCSFWSRKGI